jgi:hypothetical protein
MAAALEGIEGLLLDLSGVVYVQDEAVPGAAEALTSLRQGDMPIRLVTNTTMRPKRSILERLERLGIEAEPAELLTPATLAARRCAEAGYPRRGWTQSADVPELLSSSRSVVFRSTTVTAMDAQGPDLEAITARLERIAEELGAGPDEERAAELVREASESAAEAGRAVEAALRAATDTSSR